MNIFLEHIFIKKISFQRWPKIYLDHDLNVFKSRIQIRSKIVRIRNTAHRVYSVQ
jgi:hypothetical protein